jgi:hypothetical protein
VVERPGALSGYRAVAAAIVLVAAVLRFWALDMGLPHPMTRPDEEMILAYTSRPAEGKAGVGWAVYPPAYIYLTWAWGAAGLHLLEAAHVFPRGGYLDVLHEHPERLLIVDRTLSALAGVVTVVLLMAVTRRALGAPAALVAGAFLATSFLHVRDSHAVKPDALLTLGVVAALGTMLPLARRATLARGAAVGLAIGLAMAMKYPAVLLLFPAWVAAVRGSEARGGRRLLPAAALVAGAVAAAVFVATSPALVLDPAARGAVLGVARNIFPSVFPQGLSAPPAPLFPKDLVGLPPPRPWWGGLVYHAVFSLRYGVGLLPTLLVPVAVAWGFVSRRTLPVLAAVFAVVYYLVNGLSPMVLARYMTPLVPALAVLEAGLVTALAARLRGPRLRAAVLVLAAMALSAESFASAVAHDRLAARTDTRVLAAEWLAANVPPGSRVAMVGTQLWSWGEPVVPPTLTTVRTKPDAAALDAERIQYVVVHDHVLFTSHVDPDAMAALAPRLRLLADFDPFTGDRAAAVFEDLDAYYIPMQGFGAVGQPGPRVRIYRFE